MNDGTRYTVLVEPDGKNDPARRFAITHRRLLMLGAAVCLGMLLVAALPALLVSRAADRRTADAGAENERLAQRYDVLDQRMAEAEQALDRVRAYDAKVRRLTRADEGVRPFGIGPLSDLEIAAIHEQQEATLPDGTSRGRDDLEARVDGLTSAIEAEEVSLQEIRGYLVTREALLDAYPSGWPADGWITSRYGFRRSPLPGAKSNHTGLDVAAAWGTPIRATGKGVVIDASYRDAYGYTVEIDHGFGLTTIYAHCSRLLVTEGDEVERGDVIARLGSTGRATGPHVHYEVRRDGRHVNPELFMVDEPQIDDAIE